MCDRARDRDIQTDPHTETGRDIDIHTKRNTDTQTERHRGTDRWRERHTERDTHRHKHTHRDTDTNTNIPECSNCKCIQTSLIKYLTKLLLNHATPKLLQPLSISVCVCVRVTDGGSVCASEENNIDRQTDTDTDTESVWVCVMAGGGVFERLSRWQEHKV